MSGITGPAFRFELCKLVRATVTKVATVASVLLVLVPTTGGYVAATHSGATDMGRKAQSMLRTTGWDGYTGLAATALGVVSVLIVGFVMAWITGREFTEGTVVGLFALPVSTGAVGLAKIVAVLVWALLLTVVETVLVGAGGVLLGLPVPGIVRCVTTLFVVGATLSLSMLVIAWVATVTRGYLGGIAATLAVVVIANIAAGFGAGRFIPWTIPSLWAAPQTEVSAAWLLLPLTVAALGAGLTWRAWHNLQLGNR